MKKTIYLLLAIISISTANAQTWNKISTNFDSLWTSSVKYYNKGDTIVYYGSTTGTGSLNAKRFYISTDGGYNFTRDYTNLDAISLFPIVGLPINNMIIGFQNTPNLGSYSFQTINNWTSVLATGTGIYGEVKSGKLLWNAGSGSTTLRTLTPTGDSLTVVASGSSGIDLVSTFNKGTRLFLGGGTNNEIKYVDNGDFSTIQSSSIASQGISADVIRFFESAGVMYAVVNNGTDKLFKSTDNGVTWNIENTTYNSNPLVSSFIIGTPNGNIFFLETSTGTSDNVFLSTDGGTTATKIPIGLPTNGMLHSPTIGKILTNGNKIWYQVNAANTTDFVRTDTTIAGLYTFNSPITTSTIANKINNLEIKFYPNPTQKELFIKGVETGTKYEIINAIGQKVLAGIYTGSSINISNLSKGIYVAKLITTENQVVEEKLVIEN
ncbi:MAG: T9SS type A sorting domain-containing protein [Bacteroidia bacterium]